MTTDLAYGLTGTERATAKTAARMLAARPATGPHQRLAEGLRQLADTKRADEWISSLPVVTIDEWAVEHAPEMIREAEERDGVLHWTTRQRLAEEAEDDYVATRTHTPDLVEFMELPDATNNRPPTLLDRYPGGTAEHHHAHARLVVASIRRGYQPGPAPAPDYDPWST